MNDRIKLCECGCGKPAPITARTRQGHGARRTDIQNEQVAQLYEKGLSMQDIANRFHTNSATILHRLHEAGVSSRHPTPITKGMKFGTLTTTGKMRRDGRVVRQSRTRSEQRLRTEVICPHGITKWACVQDLRHGDIVSCKRWKECFPLKPGTKCGSLTVLEGYRCQKGGRSEQEVRCKHGATKWISTTSLKSGNTTNCTKWKACGLTRGERNHLNYLRRRAHRVNLHPISKTQQVCIICGNIRTKEALDTREHFIPVVRFARLKGMKLDTKHRLANSALNIFGAHYFCNMSRGEMPLWKYWQLHPEFEAPARQAFANMMAMHNPQNEAMRLVKRLLREMGALLRND